MRTGVLNVRFTRLFVVLTIGLHVSLTSGAMAQHIEVSSAGPEARSGQISLSACSYRNPDDQQEYAAMCGTLVVPENRADPASRLITLPVMQVLATGVNPLEPLFWLQGGPGATNYVDARIDGLLEKHDLVMVGYRGVDGDVKLDCPEIVSAISDAPGTFLNAASLAHYTRGAQACAQRLTNEGVDLAGYSMHQTIEDMEDARRALGYDAINILSNSYGTRLALIYMWSFPDSLNRVALTTINPPGGFIWDPRGVDNDLQRYADLCATDEHCRSRTPDLVATMRDVANNMPESWLGFDIDPNLVKLGSQLALFESVDTGEALPLYGPAAIDMWLDAAEGDPSGMALMSLVLEKMVIADPFENWGHFLAMGASAPDYYDPNRDYADELDPERYIIGAPFSLYLWALVQGWPATPEHQSFSVSQPSEVETLLVNGTLDFSTPLRNTLEDLVPYMPDAQLVVLEGVGHSGSIDAVQHEARERLYSSFFETGIADSSLYITQPVDFHVKKGFDDVARQLLLFASIAAVILFAGLAGLCYWLYRKVRRGISV